MPWRVGVAERREVVGRGRRLVVCERVVGLGRLRPRIVRRRGVLSGLEGRRVLGGALLALLDVRRPDGVGERLGGQRSAGAAGGALSGRASAVVGCA